MGSSDLIWSCGWANAGQCSEMDSWLAGGTRRDKKGVVVSGGRWRVAAGQAKAMLGGGEAGAV